MRKPGGYAVVVGPTVLPDGRPAGPDPLVSTRGDFHECDTASCGHCQAIMHVKPFCDPADLGGLCKHCMRIICPRCVAKNICVPWEEMIARMEARRSYEDCSRS